MPSNFIELNSRERGIIKCGSFKLRVQSQYDEETGEVALVLICPQCHQRERVPVS